MHVKTRCTWKIFSFTVLFSWYRDISISVEYSWMEQNRGQEREWDVWYVEIWEAARGSERESKWENRVSKRERACITERERAREEVFVGRPCLRPSLSPLSPSLRQQQLKCRLCSSSSALLSFPLGHLSFLSTRRNHTLVLPFFYPRQPFFSFFLPLPPVYS